MIKEIVGLCIIFLIGFASTSLVINAITTTPELKPASPSELCPFILQSILDEYSYERGYELDVFDCSDMSKITARHLQEVYGYNTEVIWCLEQRHAWVFVYAYDNTGWAIETTISPLTTLGEVIGDERGEIERFLRRGVVYYGEEFNGAEWNRAYLYIK